MKKALITGITGQDGSYLAEFLLKKGYEVHGLIRRSSHDVFSRIAHIKECLNVHYGDLRDPELLLRVMKTVRPDEIYNLAAQSHVGVSFECPEETYEINYAGVGRVVHAAMAVNPAVRMYQASTSEMFGTTQPPQNEASPMNPVSPYGKSKKRAHEEYVVGYRERKGLYICSGILFNHESPRRGEHFVTRKTTGSFAQIALGLRESFSLGLLDVRRDWGFAGDYVETMWRMLQLNEPEDFVIGTGESHSVRELVEVAGKAAGFEISWHGQGFKEVGKDQHGVTRVTIDERMYRPREINDLVADTSKARQKLGWKPAVSFQEIVVSMVNYDMTLQRGRVPLVERSTHPSPHKRRFFNSPNH